MNILIVLADFLVGGGYLPAILPLSRHLKVLGHSVEIVAVGDNLSNDEIKTFPLSKPISWCRSPLLDNWLKGNAKFFDIIHIHGLWSYPQFRAASHAIRNNIPYIVTPHGIFVEPKRYSSIKKKAYMYLIGNEILNSAQAIHVTSNLELGGCKFAGIRKPLALIPWGIDPSEFYIKLDPSNTEQLWPQFAGRRVLLFMSRLSPEKGLDQLLSALSAVKEKHKEVLLVIAGEEDEKYRYKSVLDSLVEKHGLQRYVFFTGLVQGEVRLALLKRTEIFVMPSYGENFSFSVAEALACALPVVTTTRTPWQDIQDVSAGRYVEPEAGALCNAIDELLSLPTEDLREMGKRGEKLIDEKYDWSLIAKDFEKLYADIIRKFEGPL